MLQPLYILFGAAWTCVTALALGKLLLRGLGARLYRQEEAPLAYVIGMACLSAIVFALAAAHIFYKGTVLLTGALALVAAWHFRVWQPRKEALPELPRRLVWGAGLLCAPFFLLCFTTAMAPEMSPDGNSYHLGLVARYYRAHGLERVTTNMYAQLSQGIEMLFLYAYAFGRHSGAALVHFSFLPALALMIAAYGRRFGFAAAGVAAAVIVFVTPVAGNDAASAYNDVAVAAVLFAVFYLLQIWDTTRTNTLLIPIGLVAGFAYAAKYTAFLAVPFAIGWVAWRLRKTPRWMLRSIAVISLCAAAMILPWMVKNALWVSNPVAPFFNRWFSNPYVHVSFEEQYRRHMRRYEVEDRRKIPLEVTVRGQALGGLLGPLFLLAPVALVAFRHPRGRRILGAGLLFGLAYFTNIGTRFLIPALPYFALAMTLVLVRWPLLLASLVLAHAITAWPDVMRLYCDEYAWRLDRIYWKQALRIEDEHSFLERKWPLYSTARLIEDLTPPDAKILASNQTGEAYTSREVLITFQSAEGEILRDILHTPVLAEMHPRKRTVFRIPPQPLRKIRIRQTGTSGMDHWSITEFRLFHGQKELPRDPRWRLRAHPNPWGVQDAFDGSPVTRWQSWQPASPGMFVEVDFGGDETIDRIVLETSLDQNQVSLECEGQTGGTSWRALNAQREDRLTATPIGLRKEATEVVKERGIGYLLVHENDHWAEDLHRRSSDWGVQFLRDRWGFRLYKIE
jgi:hypothetical protein